MANPTDPPKINFSALYSVIGKGYEENAIIQPGPPIEIFSQRYVPTIVLKPLQQTSGKFYYECKTHKGGNMQIGWAGKDFKTGSRGKGAGDDAHSWAYDGYRCLKWHANKNEKFGPKWNANDVIGVAIDIDDSKISFSLNGVELGTAFDKVDLKGDAVYPCITTVRGERLTVYLGVEGNPFFHDPPSGFKPLTITQDVSKKEVDFNRFAGDTFVINMELHEHNYDDIGGEFLVMDGHDLAFEATKNALIGAGYEAAIAKTESKEFDFPSKLAHCDPMGLSRDEILALICYTLEKPPVYRYFNSDSRKGSTRGVHDFPILFYLLKEACRKITASYSKPERTRTLYRGTSVRFSASVGQIIMFGAYTSSTQIKEVAEMFSKGSSGTQFVITSKLGAPVEFLSAHPEEKEVLIPPSETFEVVNVEGTGCICLKSNVSDEEVDRYLDGNGSAARWQNRTPFYMVKK